MRVSADFHIHSYLSRATSQSMNLDELSRNAKLKGLNLLGTGDFTHPTWIKELREKLEPLDDDGLFTYKGIYWMITVEVSTVYEQEGKSRKIHHVIHVPSFDIADQIIDALSKRGDLSSDGRPIFNGLSSPELVEILMSIYEDTLIIPSHAWTTWWSIFGAFSGFDSIEECYKDQTKHIFALETGLSCYDKETEVLTEGGWKRFSEINYSDKICTLNIKTDEIQFQKPTKIFVYRYKGKMYKLKTKRVDLLVTPNHKILYAPCDFYNPKPYRLKKAELLFGKSKRFKKDGSWKGKNEDYFILPAVKIKHGNRFYSSFRIKKEKKIPIKLWLKFFGFWLAEGWVSEGKNGDYNICLSNRNEILLNEMKQLLESFGYKAYKGVGLIRVRDYQLFRHLKQFGKSSGKFIPKEVKSLSKELLEILLTYYLKGDGHIYGRTQKGLSAVTISKRLRDDLQEIALKIGLSAYYKLHHKKGTPFSSPAYNYNKIYKQSEDSWTIYFIRQNRPTVLPSVIKKYNFTEAWVDYDGFVYCISVPNQVIYIRRNGIPLWCGNSDPPMNWRLSKLDRFCLMSNSDAHSPWIWRLGREFNVFDIKKLSYHEIIDAIKKRDKKRFLFTVEVSPEYGKYHYTGHRNCDISLHPKDAIKLNNRCPKCGRKLTIGVLQRVEELADRPEGFILKDAIPYKSLLPLYEIISYVMGIDQLYSKRVMEEQDKLIAKFGNELNVLIDAKKDELLKVTNAKIADAIIKTREGKVDFIAGYDGVYGKPIFDTFDNSMEKREFHAQKEVKSLDDFI
ncbi:MAG: hypothetical protein H3Z53_01020 [archaeon]|nr:hypothetical protein [archaeon]